MTLEDRVDPTRTVQQYHFIESLLTNFKNGETYSASIERMEQHISAVASSAHKQGYLEGREKTIKQVEDTIAEFGDQGMGAVSGILQESFHGKQEVEY